MTKEEKKEKRKAYYEKNRDKVLEKQKAYNQANKERIKERNKAYYEKNKEKHKEKRKANYEANRDKVLEQNKAHYEANRGKILEYQKEYRESNKERLSENKKSYYEANRDKIAEYKKANKERMNDKRRERRKTDPLYKLKSNLRHSSWKAWKGQAKPKTTEKLLGCTYNDFKDYITAQFVGNMTWENYGKVWHIDHITPLAVIKDIEQKELIESLCHFSNLQPLFAEDNLSKFDSLDYQYPEIYKTNIFHNSNKIQL